MKETIEIIENKDTNTWNARHSDIWILELFETDTLPTPYLLTTPKANVIKAVRVKYPDCKVF